MDLNEPNTEIATLPEPEIEATPEKPITNSKPKIQFRWKGKIVKESFYRHRMALVEAGKKRKKSVDPNEFTIPVEGRRIVDVALLAKHLQCTSCKEILSLRDIKSETRRGLASIFHVKCRGCEIINFVPTSSRTVQNDNSKVKLYNVNAEFVNGATKSGLTRNRLNKLLSCLNIPQVQRQLFERHKPESEQPIDVPISDERSELDIRTEKNTSVDTELAATEKNTSVDTELAATEKNKNSETPLDILSDFM